MFRRANEAMPDDAASLNDLGIALDLQEKHDEAQAQYHAALERQPAMIAARVNLGLSLALGGAPDRALAILRPLAGDPDADSRVRANLAVALAMAGDQQAARNLLAADMPQDRIEVALAGYAALRVPAK